MKKWVLRIALGVPILIAVLLGAGIGALHLTAVQQLAQDKINAIIPGHLDWQDLRLNLWQGQIAVDQFQIKGIDQKPIVSIGHLDLRLAWAALLKKIVRLDPVRIDRLNVDIAAAPGGRLNIIDALSSPDDAAPAPAPVESGPLQLPIEVMIDAFDLNKARFSYKDSSRPNQPIHAVLQDVNMALRGADTRTQSGKLTVTIADGALDMGAQAANLHQLSLDAIMNHGRLDHIDLKVDSSLGAITVAGAAEDLATTPRIQFDALLTGSLDQISKLLGQPAMQGDYAMQANVNGVFENPTATVKLTCAQADIAGRLLQTLALDLALKDKQVDLTGTVAADGLGRIDMGGKADLQQMLPQGLLTAQPNLDAAKYQFTLIQQAGDFSKILPADLQAAGGFQVEAQISGTGLEPKTMAAEAALTAAVTQLTMPALTQPVDFHVTAHSRVADGRLSIDRTQLSGAGLQADVDGQYDLGNGAMAFQATAAASDLSPIGALIGLDQVGGTFDVQSSLRGTLPAVEGQGRLSAKNLRFDPVRIGDIALQARLDSNGKLIVEQAGLINGASQITVQGDVQVLTAEHAVHAKMPAHLICRIEALHPKDFMDVGPFIGRLTGVIDIDGPLAMPQAAVKLQFDDMAVGTTRLGKLLARADFKDGALNLPSVALQNGKSRLNLAGHLSILDTDTHQPLAMPVADLRIDQTRLYLADFIESATGRVDIAGQVRGELNNPDVKLTIGTDPLALQSVRIGKASAAIKMQNGRLTIDPALLTNGKSHVRLTAESQLIDAGSGQWLQDPKIGAKLAGKGLYVDDFLAGMTGHLMPKLTVDGTLKQPRATVELIGRELKSGAQPIGDLDLRAAYGANAVTISTCRLRNGQSAIALNGSIALSENPKLDVRLSEGTLALNDFLADASGKIQIDGRIQGTINAPDGQLTIMGDKLKAGGQEIDQLQLAVRADARQVLVDPLRIVLSPNKYVSGQGRLTHDNNIAFRLSSHNLDLTDIQPLQARFPVRGPIQLEVDARGSVETPTVAGSLTLRDIYGKGQHFDDVLASFNFVKDRAGLTVAGPAKIEAGLQPTTGDFQADVRFDGLDLAPYLAVAGLDKLTGTFSSQIQARGNLENIRSLRARVDVQQMDIERDAAKLVSAEKLVVTVENQAFSIDNARLILLDDGHFKANGNGRLDGPIALTVNGQIPIDVVQHFTEEVDDAQGDVQMDIKLSGTTAQPVINGRVTLDGIGLRTPQLLQHIHDINGQLNLSPTRLTLENCQGFLDEGKFTVSAAADLNGLQPTSFKAAFNARALPVDVPDTLEMLIAAAINLNGTPEQVKVAGEVVLLDGLFYKNVDLGLLSIAKNAGRKTRKHTPPPTTQDGGALERVALDVSLKHRNPFVVDNNMALLSLKPSLRLYGTAAAPLASGRAEVESGTIMFQQKEFEITSGVIDFLNPYKIEPTINLTGELSLREWIIYLDISGTPDELKFSLRSDPPEEDGDILSLLALGKTMRELTGGDGESASSKQILADLLADSMSNSLKGATGLDIIELKYKEGEGKDDKASVDVTVGKELSRRITVKYGVESIDGETVQKVITEYKFLENFLMNAFQNTRGNYGGELQYRLEFQ